MSEGAPYRNGEFCWNELGTRNIDSALKFYQELMGWSTISHDMGEMGTYYIFQMDGKDVGAGYQMSGPHFEGVPPHWDSYVWVDDVDVTAVKAAGLGGQVLQAPMDIPNVGRMAFLKDPQGAAFAVFMGREHQGAARLAAKPGSFCWNELMTTDARSARGFYTTLLRWSPFEMPIGPEAVYTVFKVGDQSAAGMMEMKGQPPHWLSYLSVADCDMAAATAQKLGATVLVPPTDVPKTGRFAIIQDPTGAHLGIIALLPM